MKRNLLKTVIILLAVTFVSLQSCEKKELVSEQEMTKNTEYHLPNDIIENIQVENDYLQFQNNDHINAIMNGLENEYSRLIAEFNETYKDLSNDEKQIKAEEVNFNPNVVYETFEQYFNFKSLRSEIAMKEEIWLNNEELDMDSNPNNHFIHGDGQRTIVTIDGVLKIGNSIYVMKENYRIFEITDGDFKTLEKIRSDEYLKSENVIIHNENSNEKGTWKSNHSDSDDYTSGSYKMKYRITITNGPWTHFVKATTDAYYKSGWRWKNRWTFMKATCYGNLWDEDYNSLIDAYQHTQGNATGVTAKANYGNQFIQTKSNEIHGTHYVNSLGTKYIDLKW